MVLSYELGFLQIKEFPTIQPTYGETVFLFGNRDMI